MIHASSTDGFPIDVTITITITVDQVTASLFVDSRSPPATLVLNSINGPWACVAEAITYALEGSTRIVRDVAKKHGMPIRPAAYAKGGEA